MTVDMRLCLIYTNMYMNCIWKATRENNGVKTRIIKSQFQSSPRTKCNQNVSTLCVKQCHCWQIISVSLAWFTGLRSVILITVYSVMYMNCIWKAIYLLDIYIYVFYFKIYKMEEALKPGPKLQNWSETESNFNNLHYKQLLKLLTVIPWIMLMRRL
jgi:hypothetical protein